MEHPKSLPFRFSNVPIYYLYHAFPMRSFPMRSIKDRDVQTCTLNTEQGHTLSITRFSSTVTQTDLCIIVY